MYICNQMRKITGQVNFIQIDFTNYNYLYFFLNIIIKLKFVYKNILLDK